jgi:8-oxo-dGTP pyrophosphatase MutT (NUDIX family)
VLEPHLRARLHPLEGHDLARHRPRSDRDLNPGDAVRPSGELTAAAVLAGLIPRPEGLSVLLTRRSDALRRHSGQVAFPGGRAEAGETPWQTALREAEEEIGLAPDHVRLLGLGNRYETGTGYAVTPVVAILSPGLDLRADPSEVAEIFETPFNFLMNPDNHERRVWSEPGSPDRHYYAMPHEGRFIWGATAGMLRALYEQLFGDEG